MPAKPLKNPILAKSTLRILPLELHYFTQEPYSLGLERPPLQLPHLYPEVILEQYIVGKGMMISL